MNLNKEKRGFGFGPFESAKSLYFGKLSTTPQDDRLRVRAKEGGEKGSYSDP